MQLRYNTFPRQSTDEAELLEEEDEVYSLIPEFWYNA